MEKIYININVHDIYNLGDTELKSRNCPTSFSFYIIVLHFVLIE